MTDVSRFHVMNRNIELEILHNMIAKVKAIN